MGKRFFLVIANVLFFGNWYNVHSMQPLNNTQVSAQFTKKSYQNWPLKTSRVYCLILDAVLKTLVSSDDQKNNQKIKFTSSEIQKKYLNFNKIYNKVSVKKPRFKKNRGPQSFVHNSKPFEFQAKHSELSQKEIRIPKKYLKDKYKRRETGTEILEVILNDLCLEDYEDDQGHFVSAHDELEMDDELNSSEECETSRVEEDLSVEDVILQDADDYYVKAREWWKKNGHNKNTTLLWWKDLRKTWKWYGQTLDDIDIPLIPNGFTLELVDDIQNKYNGEKAICFRCNTCGVLVYYTEMYSVLRKRKVKKSHSSACKNCCLDMKHYIDELNYCSNVDYNEYFNMDPSYSFQNLSPEEFTRNRTQRKLNKNK